MLTIMRRQPAAPLGRLLGRLLDNVHLETGACPKAPVGGASLWESPVNLGLNAPRPYSTAALAGESDWIHITGMRFFGRHGVLPEETRLGQSFLVDVKLEVDTSAAGASDALEDTVSYAAVYGDIKSVVEGAPCQLLEAVAHRAVGAVLREHPAVRQVDFTIRKLSIPGVPSVVESVAQSNPESVC
ncbi:hypothetical protein PLESTB_000781300 [Pleodorina starrii]|uniref:7,8-dihydroneopterin aldolase n=1 Tax=Pleodorina starrii TaxID=330485 RepID=A0A9W6F2Y6_9CHLO|nr:hypothetical protein PLESTB_000781300 [Pleodorina starrii]